MCQISYDHSRWFTIWYACGLHLYWGVMLLLYPITRDVTAIKPFSLWMPSTPILGAILVIVALGASASLLLRNLAWPLTLGFLGPQQVLLLFSAGGAIWAASEGHYLDGTLKSGMHIITDQGDKILLGLLHLYVVQQRLRGIR